MEKYVFIGKPDYIFPYDTGTVCDITVRGLLGVHATIHTPDFRTHYIPYRSMRTFRMNWRKVC